MFEKSKNTVNQKIKPGVKEGTSPQDLIDVFNELFTESEEILNNLTEGIKGSISPTTTLTDLNALANGRYSAERSGTYQFSPALQIVDGEAVNVVPEGYDVKFIKYAIGWRVASVVKMPMLSPTGVVEEGNAEAVSGGEVFEKTVSKDSNKILPPNFEFIEIDRPDLVGFNSIIIVDKNGKYIPFSVEEEEEEEEETKKVFVAPPIDGINLLDEWFNVENVIASYDSLVEWNASSYKVVKTSVGKSSTEDRDLWMYSFYPTAWTKRILITSATHGSEKTCVYTLYKLMEQLAKNTTNDEALKYLRNNVRIDVIPIMSPTSTIRESGTLGNSRRIRETEPIPITWTKNGTKLTISFEAVDFPTSNPRVSANNYFSNPGIVGKVYVSIFDSNNKSLVPDDSYIIEGSVNARSVVLTMGTTTSGSGTANMVVSVDPNRNGEFGWGEYVSVGANSKYPGDIVRSVHANKGTRPLSLNEMYVLRELLRTNDYLFYLDCHSGSGDNYLNWSGKAENILEITALAKTTQQNYSIRPFSIYRQDNLEDPIPTITNYYGGVLGKEGLTLEWSQPNNTVTPAFQLSDRAATDCVRWISIVLSSFTFLKY